MKYLKQNLTVIIRNTKGKTSTSCWHRWWMSRPTSLTSSISKWYVYNTMKQWKPKVLVDRPEWMRNLQENFVLEKLQHWRNTSERRDSCVDQKSTEINQSHQSPFSVGVGAWAHCGRPEATTVVTQDNGVLSHFVIKLSPFVIPVTLCNNSCRTF